MALGSVASLRAAPEAATATDRGGSGAQQQEKVWERKSIGGVRRYVRAVFFLLFPEHYFVRRT